MGTLSPQVAAAAAPSHRPHTARPAHAPPPRTLLPHRPTRTERHAAWGGGPRHPRRPPAAPEVQFGRLCFSLVRHCPPPLRPQVLVWVTVKSEQKPLRSAKAGRVYI